MPPRRATRATTRAAAAEEQAKSDPDYDPSFAALPLLVRNKIDAAFERACGSTLPTTQARARKKRRIEEEITPVAGTSSITYDAPGGFITDDAPGGFVVEDTAGGFLIDDAPGGFVFDESHRSEHEISETSVEPDENDSAPSATSIPISRIPGALISLGLPADDPDILQVFDNASSGWSTDGSGHRRHRLEDNQPDEKGVSRRDWRAVCAVLMANAPGDEPGRKDARMQIEDDDSDSYLTPPEDEDEDDVDIADNDEGDDNDEDEEDEYGPSTRRKPGGRNRRNVTKNSEDEEEEAPLDKHQLAETRRAFGLFMDAAGIDISGPRPLETRRIGIREVEAAAKLLREKLTAENIVEMLELFSTSPDKTLGMTDFEKMMRVTRLV